MEKAADLFVKHIFAVENRLVFAKLSLVIGLALLLFYVTMLAQYPAIHEAFHDVRHAAGFPCH